MFEILALVLIGVLAVCAVVASLYYFRRARLHEESQPDPADTVVEMRALGQRIETLVGQQQLQGETARQQMAQKMDAVAESVGQQRTHLAGLQNELRHEVRRRDAEMEEIRTQLASVQQSTARAALAPSAPAPLALAAPTPASPMPASPPAPTVPTTAPAPTPAPPAPAPFETPTFESPTFEAPAAEAPALPAPTSPAPAFESFSDVPMGDGFAAAFSDGWDVGTPAPVFSDPFARPPDPVDAAPIASPEVPADRPVAAPAFEPVAPFAAADLFAADPPPAPPADPPAAPPADLPAEPSPLDTPPGFAFENLTTTFDAPAFEAPASWAPAFAPAGFGTSAPAAPAPSAPAAAPVQMPAPAPPTDTAWIARADRPEPTAVLPTFQIPTFETPAFAAPAFEVPAFAAPAFEAPVLEAPALSIPALEAPAAPAVPDAAAPYVPPAGADTLTVISSIDDLTQQALYMAGVTSLDEIARWSRTDARHISSVVGVSEDTILNHWVFEAQAALFQSFSSAPR
ncbi:MAG TPA: hypothetical protein VF594_12510 [Rubricoccaceae bacterium]|jgi:predicted flap endonuclease-1-like 5' DNA nuclease